MFPEINICDILACSNNSICEEIDDKAQCVCQNGYEKMPGLNETICQGKIICQSKIMFFQCPGMFIKWTFHTESCYCYVFSHETQRHNTITPKTLNDCVYLTVYHSVCLQVCLSLILSVYSLSISLSASLSVYLSVCLPVEGKKSWLN